MSRRRLLVGLLSLDKDTNLVITASESPLWVNATRVVLSTEKSVKLKLVIKHFDLEDVESESLCDSSNSDVQDDDQEPICGTRAGSPSINSILKRPHDDFYQTPPSVKRHVASFKSTLKQQYIHRGIAPPRNHILNTLVDLPKPLDKFVEKGMAYFELKTPIEDNSMFAFQTDTELTIDHKVREHARKLVECVLVGRRSWILVTCVDAFDQNNNAVDDCAMNTDHKYQAKPVGLMISKNQYNARWNEIVIRWGNIEFLAMAGYYGDNLTSTRRAFLGSALPTSVAETLDQKPYQILVRLEATDAVESVRHLRNYAKSASPKTWSFASKRFASFRPCHPLLIYNHPTRMNKVLKDKASVASFLIRIILSHTFTRSDTATCLRILDQTNEVKQIAPTTWSTVATIAEGVAVIEASQEDSPILRTLKLIANFERLLGEGDSARIGHTFGEAGPNAVDIFNRDLYPIMKSCNSSSIKELVKKW